MKEYINSKAMQSVWTAPPLAKSQQSVSREVSNQRLSVNRLHCASQDLYPPVSKSTNFTRE